jgi:hypothetical protein
MRLTETKFPETDNKKPKRKTNTHTHTQFNRSKIFPDIIIIIIIPSTTFSCLPLFPFNIDSIGVLWSPWSDKNTVPEQRLLGKLQAALLRILCR